ncbi:MAG: PAS domain-containing protein, partial [Thermofilaceae archaeon]
GISPEQVEKLPQEFRIMALSQGLQPDTYEIRSEGDLDLGTGFLSPEEVKALFRALPIEITYANKDDRIRFFTESVFHQRFVRARTIIGRRLEYCHPPRLEGAVRKVVDEIKMGKADYREFWTRIGDRIVRVLIVGVKNEEGELLGTVEIVEDFTDVINNPEEIRKKIIVL